MSLPTYTDIRSFLEGYGITVTVLTDAWITARITNFVIPFVERVIGYTVEGSETITEYLSGNGKPVLFLSRRNIKSLVSLAYVTATDYDASISTASVQLIADEGMLKAITNVTEGGVTRMFNKGEKNIKVVYTVGETTIPNDLKEAIIYLSAEQILGFVGARTGGGSISVQGFSRNFGDRGKYQDIRNDLKRQAFAILANYKSGVVGR